MGEIDRLPVKIASITKEKQTFKEGDYIKHFD
jgi:hypothetical protein